MSDSFPTWVAKIRKDPLGSTGYNRLLARARWAETLFLREHLSTSIGSGAGEHNAAEVPREVGSIYVTGGPTYNKEGFRYATGVTRPNPGEFAVALNSNPYPSTGQMAVQIQNTSEAGINKPCLSTFVLGSSSLITVYQQKLTSALGAGNAWATDDDSFVMAIHGAPLGIGLAGTQGISKQRGDELSDTSTDYNQQIQFDADLRAKFLLEHSSAGVHTNREVAKSWAHVEVNSGGGSYRIVSTGSRNALTVSRPGAGIARVTNTSAWTLSAQPFVMADYQRANSGVESDTYVACVPRSLITTTTVDIYFYKYDFGAMTWARADTDFFIVVHAG